MATEATRLRLYALISAVESDLRNHIRNHVLPNVSLGALLSEEAIGKLADRKQRNSVGETRQIDDLDYADLGDAIDAARKGASHLGSETQKHFKTFQSKLYSLVPIRNRVMHSRPLLLDDLSNTVNTCRELSKSRPLLWPDLLRTIEKLENDQDYILRIEFSPEVFESTEILHNLPLPDFDDTGFIGREDQLGKIRKALNGAFPVVTITGEGGLGKTALALKSCYDLLDDTECNFDAIIWTTAKATRLTGKEIREIDNAITSSLGIFEVAADQIDSSSEGEPLERLLNQLEAFPILLVIDNLETILDENIRSLVQRVPSGSKILFTTKRSIGAYDYPLPLEPFSPNEAAFYLRSIARFWGQTEIAQAPADQILKYCNRLQNNPLFIKWFVQAVASGEPPQRVLADPKVVLRFCLSSVFEKLSDPSQRILQTLAFDSRGATESLIGYFSELEPSEVQRSLTELMASNLVRMKTDKKSDGDTHFFASEMALFYLRNFHDEKMIDEVGLVKKRRALTAAREEFFSNGTMDLYDFNNVTVRTDGDLIAAKHLKDAMHHLKNSNISAAQSLAQQAEEISPNYFEVHRVLALIYQQDRMLMRAEERFEAAISHAPTVAPLRLWFGDFYFKYMDDVSAAEEQYRAGLQIEPNSIPLLAAVILLLLVDRNFTEARSKLDDASKIETKNTRHKRRLLDLRFQLYSRQIGHLVSTGAMEVAIDTLSELQDLVSKVDHNLIDGIMTKKVWRIAPCIEQMEDFFSNGVRSGEIDSLAVWFKAFFGSGQGGTRPVSLWEAADRNIEWVGSIRSLHEGYGFIDGEYGAIFFPFSQWANSQEPREAKIGAKASFRIGENSRGPMALKVRLQEVDTSSRGWQLARQGKLTADHQTYGFITSEDGSIYFMSYADFLDPTVNGKEVVGLKLEFDVSPDQKGRYPAAKFVRVL
ncbi:MAG: hypothetical protein JXQ91_13320 [Vannielia sp.]|uniref:NB-ARC domain-containing protein n=1 Tax=Vannielia sp. TaxID=2813045 RepID=UPI003B8BFB82